MPRENKENEQTSKGQNFAEQKTSEEAEQEYLDKKKQNAPSDTLPKVDMNTFLLSLSSSAMVHLGEVPEPETGNTNTDLNMARHTIDILGLLEEKTKGNLDTDEENLLKNILFELRVKYVQKTP